MKRDTCQEKSGVKKRYIIFLICIFIVLAGFTGYHKVITIKKRVKEIFQLNKIRQEQNYYMAESEYKMLGILYYLDKGKYRLAFELLDRFYQQLKTGRGLIKVPDFNTKEEELEFYVNRQNPKTGAFMDDAYPLGTYHGPTENVLLHIEALSRDLGRPLSLNYPLTYLDRINTIEKLKAVLDDWATVGWIASKLPQTSFHSARDILSLAMDNMHYNADTANLIIENNGLYHFSPEWKLALLQWFHDHQDPQTGLWGPKSTKGKLIKKDLNNTASVLKAFVDSRGNPIHDQFPLRYRDELFASVLNVLDGPLPEPDEPGKWHEWALAQSKGIGILTRYLWKGASARNKALAKELFEKYITVKFERFYIQDEGAFSSYPDSSHATLDGMGGFFFFQEIGVFSHEKQGLLWGTPEETIADLGSFQRSAICLTDMDMMSGSARVNSIRFYAELPDETDLTSRVACVYYPAKPVVLDIIDLTAKIRKWVHATPQSMGNWMSKEAVKTRLASLNVSDALIFTQEPPLEQANQILQKNRVLVIIGFDQLQIPIAKITFEYPV